MKSIFLCIFAITTFLIIFSSKTAYAVRPLSTEDTTVTETGELELEMGFEYTRVDNRNDNYSFVVVPCYGLVKNVQVSAEIPFDIVRPKEDSDEEGMGDIALVLKTLFLKETDRLPSFLLKTTVKLATGDEDKGLGSGDENVNFILAATKSIGQATIHGNIGYALVGKDWDSSLNDVLLYGIALEYSSFPELSVLGEVYCESEPEFNDNSHAINPLIGVAYQLNDRIRFDAAFKMGIRYESKTEYGIISGAAISF